MKTIRTFLKFDGTVTEPEDADLCREVTFDDQGKLVKSSTYFAEKSGQTRSHKVDKAQP